MHNESLIWAGCLLSEQGTFHLLLGPSVCTYKGLPIWGGVSFCLDRSYLGYNFPSGLGYSCLYRGASSLSWGFLSVLTRRLSSGPEVYTLHYRCQIADKIVALRVKTENVTQSYSLRTAFNGSSVTVPLIFCCISSPPGTLIVFLRLYFVGIWS